MNDSFPWLTSKSNNGQTLHHEIKKEAFLIGRDDNADLLLETQAISRMHACIHRSAGVWKLEDLNSRNGTFLNGKAIGTQAQRLHDGDMIVLGGEVTLRFHDPRETIENVPIGSLDGVWINPKSRNVWVDAHFVNPPLSANQYTLLERLSQTPGEVVGQAEIIAAVWPDADPNGVSKEAIDSLIKRLRARLHKASPDREYIEVLRGHGVRLICPKE